MYSVAKLCADHLRSVSNNQGVNLKSGHAHELVAALFGYNSKAAMSADTLSPEKNLSQIKILVQMPLSFIEDRQSCLEGLSNDLPDIDALGWEMFEKLKSEKQLSFWHFSSWAHLAEALTTEYLQKHSDMILPLNFRMQQDVRDIFTKPQYKFDPAIVSSGGEIELIVTNSYNASSNARFHGSIDIKVSIKLQRIVGYVGYSDAQVSFIDGSSQSFTQTGVAI